MPNGIRGNHRAAPSYASEFSPEIEPSTPAEFALHVVLMQFVTGAEQRIEDLLQETLVRMHSEHHDHWFSSHLFCFRNMMPF